MFWLRTHIHALPPFLECNTDAVPSLVDFLWYVTIIVNACQSGLSLSFNQSRQGNFRDRFPFVKYPSFLPDLLLIS